MQTYAVVVESAAAAASVLVESSVTVVGAVVVAVAAAVEELGVDGEESWEDNWGVDELAGVDNVDMEVSEVQDKQDVAMMDGMLWVPAQYDRVLAAASDGGKDRQAPSEAQR